MKNIFIAIAFVLSFSIISGFCFEESIDGQKKINFIHSPLDLSKSDIEQQNNPDSDLSNLKNSDWYTSAMSYLQKSEYNIKYDEKLGAYQSPNRANNMRFIYHKDGFTAKLRDNKIPLFNVNDKILKEKDKKYKYLDEWEIQFRIMNEELGIENGEIVASGNKAFIENGNLRIDYTNNEDGMRQDFIIKNKPASIRPFGKGEGKLRLNFSADTKLKMILGADALMFKDKKNDIKLKYSSLKCWDANGHELRAYFENNSPSLNHLTTQLLNQFSIVVNDEDAVYPITIDPLSSTPVWTAEPNQDGAYFGASVATAGDVNGDGKSDVIVGAFLYDNGQTNEGGVFVYHGSVNGLSVSPAWTSEGNQENADFGLSVATAGDVNGDGYSDVIISAPYFDHGQTDEGIIYVYLGSPSGLESNPFWTYENNQQSEAIGYGIGCAGDYNADGLSDLIIGGRSYDNGQTDEGRIYTFKGNATSISTTPDWTYENNSADSQLGFVVGTAGDINGDGFSDIVAGAFNYANAGRAYIFLSNGTTFPASPNTTLTGTQAGEHYGQSISTAGDINADGYSDIVVGSPLFDNGQTDEGKCFAYLGSASGLVTTPNWTKESNEAGGWFGISVSTAGDINGDGYADIILGGNKLDDGVQTDEGRVFLYLGKNSGVNFGSTLIYESNQAYSEFGYSVALAGDVNGDGFSDVVVGAYRYSNGQDYEGRAFLYLGSAHPMSTTQNVLLEKNQASSLFGCSVSTAGDVNGDGYADVIIGASDFDNGQTDEGSAFVFHGSATGLSFVSNWTAESNQATANFGNSVSTAGDVNGDGYSDVIIGAYHFSNQQSNEGRVFIYHGSASGLSPSSNLTIESNQTDAYFGESVSTAGDVNGDGYSDVLVGSPNFDNGQTNEGRAFVYSGSSTGLSGTASWTTESNQIGSEYGSSVSSAGDVNGDGYSDVIIGAPLYDQSFTDAGRAYLYRGSSTGLLTSSSWVGTSGQLNSHFGNSVSCAGNVNGDGFSDIIVGASSFSNGQSFEGKAFLYYGSDQMTSTADWTAESNIQLANFGVSVSSAGDVNGDGYSDVIVGATGYDNGQVNEGKVYIYNGSPAGLSSVENWTSEANQDYADFGSSVSSAGDVNGDGFSDVIVGASAYDNGQTDEGTAFVYYGGFFASSISSNPRQFKPGSVNVVSSGMITGTDGGVKLQLFAKSPFGKSNGRVIYEVKENGSSFSGSSNASATVSLGLTGTVISKEITGLNVDKLYKWRSRVQYSMSAFPFQKFGPWKYYNNYIPNPHGNFRPTNGILEFSFNLTTFIEGFYNSSSNNMTGDTVTVELRNSSQPYNVIESNKQFLTSNGTSVYSFINAVNGTPYYLVLKHRNSIETWSKFAQQFASGSLTFDFSDDDSRAFGDNQKQVDTSPVRFGIYSGDVNQDGFVELTDITLVYNDASSFISGYALSDVNGDNNVDLTDITITFNNSNSFVRVMKP